MKQNHDIPEEDSLSSAGKLDSNGSVEPIKEYILDFNELKLLGSVGFGKGQTVSFQPCGRYEEGRQTGTVRIWEEDPNLVTINFLGSKVGIPYPDSERITLEKFDTIKHVLKVKKEN